MSILFHGSFGLYRDRLARVLKAGLDNPGFSDKQLAEPLGYGAPFAAKYRSWLHKTGLTNQKLPLQLTDMGKVVYDRDPDFSHQTTVAFLHHQLTQTDRAFAWHYFVNDFLPQHDSFTRDDLVAALAATIESKSLGTGTPSKMAGIIARKLLECYTEDYSLGSLGLLVKEGSKFKKADSAIAGPWGSVSELSNAYSG